MWVTERPWPRLAVSEPFPTDPLSGGDAESHRRGNDAQHQDREGNPPPPASR